ncbi:MAG TPA: polysaccharide biosynthesis C-terminal domain-containing protein [Pyrinomonadaceae bacterium]
MHPLENPAENSPNASAASERQSASWDVQNAPKNYFSLVLTQGASAIFAFASVWLITKMLGSAGYGGIVAIIAASQVAQVLVNWTSVAVVRFGVDEFIETERIARAFWTRFFILLPNLVLVFLTSNLWFPPLAAWLRLSPEMFWLVFLHFTATALGIHFQFSYQAVKMPRLQGGMMTAERILIFAGLLVLTAAGRLNGVSAFLCYACVPFVMALIGFFYLRKFIFSRFSIDQRFIKKIFVYSLPLLPFTLVGYFSGSYVDAVFISKFLSVRDLGIYSVATQINGIALQLPTLANSLLIPLFITLQRENRAQKLNGYFKNILPSLTLAWSFFCAFLGFAGYFFIPLVFGAEFAGAVTPFWILLAASTLGLPILIGYSALSHSISATYISMFAAIFSALGNIAFNFWLIPVFGAEGCAWATVVMYFVSSATFYILLRRTSRIPLSWMLGAILPILASAGVFSLTRNPFVSLLTCAMIGVLIIFLHKNSMREAFAFLKTLRK